MNVEEEYFDTLQNIEFAIVEVYRNQPSLLDLEVLDAFDGLIRVYGWEKEGRGTPSIRLSERSQQVFDKCRRICEWRLGRQPLNPGEPEEEGEGDTEDLPLPEVLLCLKRVRSSVRLWNTQGGRQGYLNYICQFLDDAMQSEGT